MVDFRRSFPFQTMAKSNIEGDLDSVTLIGTLYEQVRRCYEEDIKASLGVLSRALESIGHQPPHRNQDDMPEIDMQLGPTKDEADGDITRGKGMRVVHNL